MNIFRQNRFKTALEIQQGANLRALTRALVHVTDAACDEAGGPGYDGAYDDAAIVLVVGRIADLVDLGVIRRRLAYDECSRRAEIMRDRNFNEAYHRKVVAP